MRLKWMFWLMVFLTGILIIASFTLYSFFRRSVEEGVELHLVNYADDLVLDIAKNPDLFTKHPERFLLSSRANEFSASGILVQFRDSSGKLISSSPGLKYNVLPFSRNESELLSSVDLSDGTKLKVYQRHIDLEGRDLGYVLVGMSTLQMYRALENLRNTLVIIMSCTLLILIFGVNTLMSFNLVENQKKFLSFTSHELRTSLSIISGLAEVALRREQSPEEYRNTLGEIKEESEWMNRLVSNLLLIFRGELSAQKPKKIVFNFAELVAEAASALKKRYPSKNLILNLPSEAEIKGDPLQIKQVVNNLLENAARYTAQDGRIEISLISEPRRFILKVCDDGMGIKKSLQKKIFDAFYRVEQGGGKGMGLGLAISKKIVKAHGGSIHVESEPGKGSTFTVNLPRQ